MKELWNKCRNFHGTNLICNIQVANYIGGYLWVKLQKAHWIMNLQIDK